MNINGWGSSYSYTGVLTDNVNNSQDFGSLLMTVESSSTGIVLHGAAYANEGEKSISAWADVQTGISVTIYEPADFDEDNPVYHLKIWDKDGNVTERYVDILKVDPADCNYYDMYAYSVYLSRSGEYPDAQTRFLMTQANYQGRQADYSQKDMAEPLNWLKVLGGIMQEQYSVRNFAGYIEYKKFYDFLCKQKG